ncbi:ABC transporter permease, partial [Streptomyces sp. SID4982]|nr:ABC transporter permease [Streptomyces sp. SID4982]
MTELTLGSRTFPDRGTVVGWLQNYGVYLGLAVLLLFNVVFTDHFVSGENFRTQAVQVSPVLIVALGMALAIGTEGIDLSVGAVMALATSVTSLYLGYGPWIALVAALVG